MKLPRLAVENYQFVMVAVLLLLGLGALSFLTMPRAEDPLMESPFYTIVAVYPGTSPKDMEELVVNPIEEELSEIEDLDQVLTNIEDGVAMINIEADYAVNIDEKYDELVTAVNALRSELPEQLNSIEVFAFNPLDVVTHQFVLLSDQTVYRELLREAEVLEKSLEQIPGIRTVDIHGYPEEVVRIAPHFEKMAALQLSLPQVEAILSSNNFNVPGGDLELAGSRFSIETSGGYQSIQALRNTPIASNGDQIIYLRDIAEVYFDYEDERYQTRFDGAKGLFISVTQKKGENIPDLSKKVEQVVLAYQEHLPSNMQLQEVFQQAPAVEARINDFFLNLGQGVLLVGLLILLFLGFRTAIVVMMVIPTSILMAILALDQSGFGLQQISIAGLVIALGLLVDNGIVVVENINRLISSGTPLREAVIKGTSEVGWALVSATATTVLAFFPMTQLGGGTGEYLRSLPIIVIYVLLASLLLALTLTPLLSSRLLPPKVVGKQQLIRVMDWLTDHTYRPVLAFSLRRPGWVMLAAAALLGGSIWLFPKVGISFFPTADKPIVLIDIELPDGSSLAQTEEATLFVEEVLSDFELIKGYASNIGHGNPQIYYNVVPQNYKKSYAQVLVILEEWKADSYYGLINTLRERFRSYPTARIKVSELKNGPPNEAPIALRVIGQDLDTLKELSLQVQQILARKAGVLNIENPFAQSITNIKVRVNQDKASLLGLRMIDIDLAVRTAVTGKEIGSLQTKDAKEYPMVIRSANPSMENRHPIQSIYVHNVRNAAIPLRQVAKLEFVDGITRIDHFNMERMATVTADVQEGLNSGTITEDILKEVRKIELPQGYTIRAAGEYETQQESFGNMGALMMIALFGIFAVLILQFRSVKQPLIVLSAIPLAFTGSIGMLYLSGYSFSFFAFVGFTSLIGIVVNTSIILVDYTNQLRIQGMELMDAITQAASTRFRPILLTTLTTVTGLLPLTLTNSNLWSPLGWTIIGGMISSTLLTLLIVPILYKWMR